MCVELSSSECVYLGNTSSVVVVRVRICCWICVCSFRFPQQNSAKLPSSLPHTCTCLQLLHTILSNRILHLLHIIVIRMHKYSKSMEWASNSQLLAKTTTINTHTRTHLSRPRIIDYEVCCVSITCLFAQFSWIFTEFRRENRRKTRQLRLNANDTLS